jgi:hypothetical protein
MSYIKDAFQRILSNEHSKYDLGILIRSIIRPKSDEDDNIKRIFILGNNNVIQYGNSNVSTLQIDNSTYNKKELDIILNALRKHLQEENNIACNEDCQNLEPRDFPTESIIKEKISYRHLTGLNEYSTLSLVENGMPVKLRTILGIKKPPIVYTDNPIIENIRKFQRETGNYLLINYEYNNATMSHATNTSGQTTTGLQSFQINGEGERLSVGSCEKYSQSVEDFENETLSYGVRVTFYRENLPALIFCWCC